MKKIINGRKYDTDTAEMIDSYDNGLPCTDFAYFSETLYQKCTKEFFVYGHGGAASRYRKCCENGVTGGEVITPLSVDEAKKWVENNSTAQIYEELFGKVDE